MSREFPYSDEQLRFLKDNIKGRSYSKITAMFNERFDTSLTRYYITKACRCYGLSNEKPERFRYSDEHIRFLKENVKGRYYSELTTMFNEHFGTNLGMTAIRETCRKYKMQNRMNGGFQKGHTMRTGCALPDGVENTNVAGYRTIKHNGVWRGKHVVLWEKDNGSVPEGHYIVFGDGNRENFSLDNLFCVSAAQGGIRSKLGLKGDTPELAEAGIALAGLYAAINKRRKKKKGDCSGEIF